MASCYEPHKPLPTLKPLCGIKCPSGQITSEDGCSCKPLVGGCAGTKFGCCPEDSWYPEEAAWGPKGKGCYDFRDPMDALQKTAKEQQQDENASPTEKKADQEKRIADQKEKKADQKKRL